MKKNEQMYKAHEIYSVKFPSCTTMLTTLVALHDEIEKVTASPWASSDRVVERDVNRRFGQDAIRTFEK